MFIDALLAAIERLFHQGPFVAALLCVLFVTFVGALLQRGGKGKRGERRVNRALRSLPETYYRLYPDIYLPVEGGSTQIDHLVVSPYGLFIIETKEYSGTIYGREREATWTQRLGRKSVPFQNPLRQNYGHMKAVAAIIGSEEPLVPLVVFAGSARFGKERPDGVHLLGELLTVILARQTPVLDTAATQETARRIEAALLPNTRATRKAHIAHVKKTVGNR